ncbi:MAG: nuclease [Desulfobulbaceae bacterium A2]|nr:MAG: nuclease [Desulfobulbaceae bacterium A2]
MQNVNGKILYSASDVINFLECEHLTALDVIDLDTPLPRTQDDAMAQLTQQRGMAHENQFVEVLRQRHGDIVDISKTADELEPRIYATRKAMNEGSNIIYQAALGDGNLIGHADFLRRVPPPSQLVDFSYEVLDTKLARSTKTKFLIQLSCYSMLLAKHQGTPPRMMHVILGDNTEQSFSCADYSRYFAALSQRFLDRMQHAGDTTYPAPCNYCGLCKWRDLCEEQRLQDDHLCQVANIRKSQIKKLHAAGVRTLKALALLPPGSRIPNLAEKTLDNIRHQAALQFMARQSGEHHYDILPQAQECRGFRRLPLPSPGDLFLDMEGDPLEAGGLEYLFGLYFHDQGKPQFKALWAHTRAEEKQAFEACMDFITNRLDRYPDAHIYHYASYEETALKKLMSLHGSREAAVDNLLRAGKLIDLYKVVRESIRVSEPSYSIKNIEKFYKQGRSGAVTNASASIVYYELWKNTGDMQLLKEIEGYNLEDVQSTFALREWLLTLRPPDLPWANQQTDATLTRQSTAMSDTEKRLAAYRELLLDPLPSERGQWGHREHCQELLYYLLDFHRRAAKPAWWAMFNHRQMDENERLEDGECLAGLVQNPLHPPYPIHRSRIYTCSFPPQESKIKIDDSTVCIETGGTVEIQHIDYDAGHIQIKYANNNLSLPDRFSLGPSGPISAQVITDALFRLADSLIATDERYPAAEAILQRAIPKVRGMEQGQPLVNEDAPLHQVITTITNLDNSYLVIQGPPGSGKTYTGAHVIVGLLRQGFRVGVTSNSHKAITNLLHGVEQVATSAGFAFCGAKKSTASKPESTFNGRYIIDVFSKDEITDAHRLVAGTAWLFSDIGMDRGLDFLFVDEAGQVALANLLAMSTSARNIVLLGDQMQLGQPIQGIHPGRSGESSLEYLLDGLATIPPEYGIFLKTTWRMHPAVCRFISDAVYDSRLEPEPRNVQQTLLLNSSAHSALLPAGIRFVPLDHEDCSQRCLKEAHYIRDLVANLLEQRYHDKNGRDHPMTLANILVVAPYNMQVNLLKQTLPKDTRIGTVDKFQGQEAEVVIISMTTSNGDTLPRHLSFLYSKNRLNVAISRAKCLAILVANPALMTIKCSKPEDMALVNTLCWATEHSNLNAL